MANAPANADRSGYIEESTVARVFNILVGANQHGYALYLVIDYYEDFVDAPATAPADRRKLNLTRIESRPSRLRPWDYIFFLDVTGHYEDPAMQAALKELSKKCPLVKWLGSYPVAKK